MTLNAKIGGFTDFFRDIGLRKSISFTRRRHRRQRHTRLWPMCIITGLLNGSSSPVLTATSLSYGKAKNSTSQRIKTPDMIEIKFGTVDYVGEMTPRAKFNVNPSKGASRQMGEIYAKIFLAVLFFRNSPTGQTLRRIFACDGSNDAVSCKHVPLGG